MDDHSEKRGEVRVWRRARIPFCHHCGLEEGEKKKGERGGGEGRRGREGARGGGGRERGGREGRTEGRKEE